MGLRGGSFSGSNRNVPKLPLRWEGVLFKGSLFRELNGKVEPRVELNLSECYSHLENGRVPEACQHR